MKIVFHFQFFLIISHFGTILKESMMVEISKISIVKASVFYADFLTVKIFS